ncbi:MAG: hypothetical protein EOP87_03480 [Verrucomicrobiaceae bacterium]|nr:MAG: hypothetical protein EOP87_03480 [Verrucomicrobiaceae bacterium]
MNPADPRATEVWNRTLNAVRRTRRRRRMRTVVLTFTAVLLPVLLAVSRKDPAHRAARVVESRPPVTVAEHPALAVLVMRDGVPTLQALHPGDLPDTELHLSLAPILADYRDLSEDRF